MGPPGAPGSGAAGATTDRFWAVDGALGDDLLNAGYSDVSLGSAGTIPFKTLAKLLATVPREGNGHTLTIGIKTGTYAEAFNFENFTGYSRIVIRSTDSFADDAGDKTMCSAVVAVAGPGAGSVWTVHTAPTPTSTVIGVTGGATEDTRYALNDFAGCRVRMLTGARHGAVGCVQESATDDAGAGLTMRWLTLLQPLAGGAPAAGDTLIIEDPGVIITGAASFEGNDPGGDNAAGVDAWGALSVIGIDFQGTRLDVSERSITFSFCKAKKFLARQGVELIAGTSYRDTSLAWTPTGAGLYGVFSTGEFHVYDYDNVQLAVALRHSLSSFKVDSARRLNVDGWFGGAMWFINCRGEGTGGRMLGTGGHTPPRALSGVNIDSSSLDVAGLLLGTGTAAASTGISVANGSDVTLTGITGFATSGAAIGFAGSDCKAVMSGNLAGGALGAISMAAAGVIVDHDDVTLTNIQDQYRNRLIGTIGEETGLATAFVADMDMPVGSVARIVNATGHATLAQSDTLGHATSGLWVAVTSPASGAAGLFVPMDSPMRWVLCHGVPNVAWTALLYDGAPGMATTAPHVGIDGNPVPYQRRIGFVSKVGVTIAGVGTMALLIGSTDPEPLDGSGHLVWGMPSAVVLPPKSWIETEEARIVGVCGLDDGNYAAIRETFMGGVGDNDFGPNWVLSPTSKPTHGTGAMSRRGGVAQLYSSSGAWDGSWMHWAQNHVINDSADARWAISFRVTIYVTVPLIAGGGTFTDWRWGFMSNNVPGGAYAYLALDNTSDLLALMVGVGGALTRTNTAITGKSLEGTGKRTITVARFPLAGTKVFVAQIDGVEVARKVYAGAPLDWAAPWINGSTSGGGNAAIEVDDMVCVVGAAEDP
jgi:hypothetical protein